MPLKFVLLFVFRDTEKRVNLMEVKSTAITYSGYEYQTLHGVGLLVEWLNSPNRYIRAAFDADKESNQTPEGIDDIVFERPDGVKDYWQVKFTPSPDKNFLTWDWLLTRTGKTDRSRSIIKKIYDAIASAEEDKLGDVVLLTNKRPDRQMENCLVKASIDYEKVDKENREKIASQLGSVDAATFLFSRLTVQHSDGDYHVVKRNTISGIQNFSDDNGFDRLIGRVREWGIFKGNPQPDGWVYLHHIREILSPQRPKPIPEIFTVPDDYFLPNTEFHESLLERVMSSKREVITVTGKPGVGKSTYLSFLCEELGDHEIPLIRHHYFLSLSDTTSDRLSPRIVAESLLHQIDSFYKHVGADTHNPENLRSALAQCANYFKGKNKPFVVLIDGLDHVWRDNAKNKKPLDDTFRQLLPVIENLVVVVGTQPIDDELLPNVLLKHSPKANWQWLPEMSGNSIYEYLKFQCDSQRLYVNDREELVDEEIKTSANSLLELTKGYPLQLIYSTEYLAQSGEPLSSWQIDKLPPCVDGDITAYYSDLWRTLTYRQKDVLHLCCGFGFAWLRKGISTIIEDEHDIAPSVNAVAHLLFEGKVGVRPFHESLVVYVRNDPEHEERISTLLPSVCHWLERDAPEYLKDNWYWFCLAKAGDSRALREGVVRDWVLDRLIKGVSVDSFIRLLTEAEAYAFEEREYAEAYKHRSLKTRLLNGPEFQAWDLVTLESMSIIQAEKYTLDDILSRVNSFSPQKLATLSIALWWSEKHDEANLIANKAFDFYRSKTKLLPMRHSHESKVETEALIKSGVLTDSLNYDAIFEGENFANWPDGYISSFTDACRLKRDLELLVRARSCLKGGSKDAENIELDAIRISLIEDADIKTHPEYQSFSSQYLSTFLETVENKKLLHIGTHFFEGDSTYRAKVKTSYSYHHWFFSSLCINLNAAGSFSWLPVDSSVEQVDVSVHYDLINELADRAANEVRIGNKLSFDFMCMLFPTHVVLEEIGYYAQQANNLLKQDWIKIAADCHLASVKTVISEEELTRVIELGVFKSNWLRIWYKNLGLNLLSNEAAKLLIVTEAEKQKNGLDETIEKSTAFLELSEIALRHQFSVLFEKYLRVTWDFVLGYGHHKDITLIEVLEAIEYLSIVDPDSTLEIVKRISPVVLHVSEFTDGDETRHSLSYLTSLLAKLNPQTLASKYNQELKEGEWYDSDDTLLKLVNNADFNSSIVSHLYKTGLSRDCYKVLHQGERSKEQNATQLAGEIEDLLGISIASLMERKNSDSGESTDKITFHPSDYPPNKFEELTEELRKSFSSGKFWKIWYEYWSEQGKEAELLKLLTQHNEQLAHGVSGGKYLLDALYFTQRKLGGKTKAFKFLVEAHNAINGWSIWGESSEDTFKRLQIVADQYRSRVDEFIRLTTQQSDHWKNKLGSLIVPDDKLVFLLAQAGRKEEAFQLVLSMVDSLEESVRNLQLSEPEWDWSTEGSINEALELVLVSRLKIPVPSVKLWVMEQLSQLLVDGNARIEELLIHDLHSRVQESECVEVLCVFLSAKHKGYIPPGDLGGKIKARSVLSDLILTNLIPNPKGLGAYSKSVTPLIDIDGDNHRFDYYQGNQVERLYFSQLKRFEDSTEIPFTGFYRSEWNKTFDYLPESNDRIDYYLNSDTRRNTGQFYTKTSHRGRSAFLRTIEIAKQYFGMPDSHVHDLATHALPIEPAYLGFNPQQPKWLPEWKESLIPDETTLHQFSIDVVIKFKSDNSQLDLLAISMPIKLSSDSWIDLTLVRVTEFVEPDTIDLDERGQCDCVGLHLNNYLEYGFVSDEGSSDSLFAMKSYPLSRYGHWHSDLESRGLYIPKCNVDGKSIFGATDRDGLFWYSIEKEKIGFSSYWYSNWQESHPKMVRSLCGSYTVANKEAYKWLPSSNTGNKMIFLCQAIVLSSEDTLTEHEYKKYEFCVEVH